MTSYAPGTFCWVDLAATDQDAAKQFYSSIFGWTSNDMPMPDGANYSMMLKGGKTVGAIAPMQPMQKDAGSPPTWNSYIAVENVDNSANKAASLGGTIVMPPMDVPEAGRMAVVQDPAGAYVSLWQAGSHKGAEVVNETGAVAWQELITNDTEKSKDFYSGLLGWNPSDMPMGEMTYTIFNNGEKQAGGMFALDPNWGPIPPNWTVYFAVEDCDATLDTVKALGGKVLMGPNVAPGVGKFATCQDPQGGAFAVLQPEMSAQLQG